MSGAAAPRMLDAASPLAAALDRRRSVYNAKFAATRTGGAKVDPDDLFAHLATTVAPAIDAVASFAPERVDVVVEALFDLSLQLVAETLVGPKTRYPAVDRAWRTLLPALPRLVARDPRTVAGAITNAVYNLATMPGARADAWVDRMLGVARRLDSVPTLLDAGKAAAWLAGMPHYRAGALAAVRSLPLLLAVALLNLPADVSPAVLADAIGRLERNPWLAPADAVKPAPDRAALRARVVGRAGAFRGFGGTFIRPPTVARVGTRFVVSDGQGSWNLAADRFGAVLLRTPDVVIPPRAGASSMGGLVTAIPELNEPVSVADDGRTLAVTLRDSHHVFLVALTAD